MPLPSSSSQRGLGFPTTPTDEEGGNLSGQQPTGQHPS